MNYKNDLEFDRLIGVAAVAAILGVCRTTVIDLVRRGELPAAQVGNQFRIPERGVYEYLHAAGLDRKYICRNGAPAATAGPISAIAHAGTVDDDRATGVIVR